MTASGNVPQATLPRHAQVGAACLRRATSARNLPSSTSRTRRRTTTRRAELGHLRRVDARGRPRHPPLRPLDLARHRLAGQNPETNPHGADLNYPKNTNGYSLGWTWIVRRAGSDRHLRFADEPLRVPRRTLTRSFPLGVAGPRDQRRRIVPTPDPGAPSSRSTATTSSGTARSTRSTASTTTTGRSTRTRSTSSTTSTFGPDWIVSPELRFYSQTRRLVLRRTSSLVPQTYMSADYRLSPLRELPGRADAVAPFCDSISREPSGATVPSQHSSDADPLFTPAADGERRRGRRRRPRPPT